jgi:hypothetical protein
MVLLLSLAAGVVDAQVSMQDVVPTVSIPAAAPVPFGPGEAARYQVRLGLFGDVGEGSLTIGAIDTIRGNPTYHLRMHIKGGIPFAHVDTKYESWLDVRGLMSHRFHQDQHEVRYKRKRTFNFFPEERRWELVGKDESGELPTNMPLDDLSFLYFARTLPLEVGREYTFNRYFQDDGNPVRLKVLRTETVKVPAGTFETIVVQPIIKSKGLFSEGGEAEVYFTNDHRRILVMLKSKVKILRSLDLMLEEYTPGSRLTAAPAAFTESVSGH